MAYLVINTNSHGTSFVAAIKDSEEEANARKAEFKPTSIINTTK